MVHKTTPNLDTHVYMFLVKRQSEGLVNSLRKQLRDSITVGHNPQ